MGYRSPNDQLNPSTSEDDLVLGFYFVCFSFYGVPEISQKFHAAFLDTNIEKYIM